MLTYTDNFLLMNNGRWAVFDSGSGVLHDESNEA